VTTGWGLSPPLHFREAVVGDEDALKAGMDAAAECRGATAYRLLLPFAEQGHAEAQAVIGSLVSIGLHRFESIGDLERGATTFTPERVEADRLEAGRWLTAASDTGIGAASFNLAGLYFLGYSGGSWEERRAKVAELYARAYQQGFTPFAHLTGGGSETPGEPYLGLMEGYARAKAIPLPGCSEPQGDDPK
jgi:TPR repeat protein